MFSVYLPSRPDATNHVEEHFQRRIRERNNSTRRPVSLTLRCSSVRKNGPILAALFNVA
jgi:hypothetical protein